MNGSSQWLVDAYNKPDTKPFTYKVGQTVRVLNNRSKDGQTPPCWDGGLAIVLERRSTGLMKYHYYYLRHLESGLCDYFEEDELDKRWIKT